MKCDNCKKHDDCAAGSGLVWPCGAYDPKVVTKKHKIKRLVQKMACFLFLFMYAIGWFMTYMFLAFLIFGDAMVGYESVVAVISALAGGVSGGLLYVYILKS